MTDFSQIVEKIKSQLKKEQLKVFDSIESYDSLNLASIGSNDVEGYQVFTPNFIVKDMCDAIGEDMWNLEKNILEPTSGDGAFTTYILQKRLERIFKEKENFELNSLKALSTIYSIEMDKDLIIKQRNNILTVVKLFIKKHKIKVYESYYDMAKLIITTNFIWAMFNSNRPIDAGLFGTEVAYKMPSAEKNSFNPIEMPVWKIEPDNISLRYEGVEIW